MIKIYHIRYVDDLQWIVRCIQDLYKVHSKSRSKKRIKYFQNCVFVTEMIFKVMSTLYLLSVFTFFPYPLYMYYFEHEVVTIIPIHIPFVDDTTFVGYIIVSAYQIILFVLATTGVLACDSYMAIIIVSTLIFAKLIAFDMEQIDDDLLLKDPMITVRSRFRNILLMHQETIRQVNTFFFLSIEIKY